MVVPMANGGDMLMHACVYISTFAVLCNVLPILFALFVKGEKYEFMFSLTLVIRNLAPL